MYDTIHDLNAKLAANGTKLMDVARQVDVQRAGVQDRVHSDHGRWLAQGVLSGDQGRRSLDEGDITIIDYVFKEHSERCADPKESAGRFGAGCGVHYRWWCDVSVFGPDCRSTSLGTPAAVISRSIAFASMNGAGGHER